MFSDYGIQVLVVDDDPIVCSVLRRLLRDMGFTVHVALDLSSALERVKRADILLLDLFLNNGEGSHDAQILFDQWVEAKRGAPLCIITGRRTTDIENEYLGRRAWNVLSKPVPTETLREVFFRYGTAILDIREREELKVIVGDLKKQYYRSLVINGVLILVVLFGDVVPPATWGALAEFVKGLFL